MLFIYSRELLHYLELYTKNYSSVPFKVESRCFAYCKAGELLNHSEQEITVYCRELVIRIFKDTQALQGQLGKYQPSMYSIAH